MQRQSAAKHRRDMLRRTKDLILLCESIIILCVTSFILVDIVLDIRLSCCVPVSLTTAMLYSTDLLLLVSPFKNLKRYRM